MKPINKYVIDVNEYLNKQFQFFAHLKEDKITKEIKKETLNDHTVLCIKYFEKMVRTKSLEKVFRNFKEVFFEKLSLKAEVLLNEIVINVITFHDIGKINPNFQHKNMNNDLKMNIRNFNKLGTRHSIISAILYLDYFLEKIKEIEKDEKFFLRSCIFINSYIISKHHGDLNEFYSYLEDLCYEDGNGYKVLQIFNTERLLYEKKLYLNERNIQKQVRLLKNYINSLNENQGIYLYTYSRFIFSILVASDFYATNEFMNNIKFTDFGEILNIDEFYDIYKKTKINVGIREYEKNFYGKYNDFKKVSDMNILRNEMFLDAEKEFDLNKQENIFFLEAPTGSGKSNVAMNLSFKALKDNIDLNKIFYIYPYNTLVEQNLKSLKEVFDGHEEIFNKIAVINSIYPIKMDFVEMIKDKNEEYTEYYNKAFLNRQFLNYPIILTTHVSIFDTMFNNSKESILAFYQLANSILILDEIQSYKNTIWSEIITFLKCFAKILNIKIIIMSATLPDLDLLSNSEGSTVKLIKDREKYFSNPIFKDRVVIHYDLLNKINTLDELAEFLLSNDFNNKKVLIEFIKKDSAYKFYNMIKDCKGKFNVQLMTGDDNLDERERILEKTRSEKNILLVATQVVEAGIDIDMDIGFKDISMVDNDEQFMGRINRSCKKQGIVYFFNIDEEKSIYRNDVRVNSSLTLINEDMREILAKKDFANYYKPVLEMIKNIYNESFSDSNLREFFKNVSKLNFNIIKERMKLIDDDKWSMSVFLSRNIHVKKEGKNSLLIGEDIWQKYKKLLMNGTMDYSEKQVKLSEVRSLMNYFIYEIKRNENLVYDDKIGELYFIRNGDNYFNNNKLNKEKLEHEGELFINI